MMQHWAQTILEDAFWLTHPPADVVQAGLQRLVALMKESEYHVFRTPEIAKLADDLADAESIAELSQLMWQLAVDVGFQNYVIFVLKDAPGVPTKTRVCTSFKDSWVSRYQRCSYQLVDPVILEANSRDGYFQFSDLRSSAPVVESFWKDAERHGIGRNGLCFAITRRNGMRLGISYCTSKSAAQVRAITETHGYDLKIICDLVADSFSFLTAGPSLPDNTLSLEELRFLKILASSPDPVAIMNSSPKWGSQSNLQSSIRLKLGVQSAFQAVAMATSMGWFNLLPYDETEVEKPFPVLRGLTELGESSNSLEGNSLRNQNQ